MKLNNSGIPTTDTYRSNGYKYLMEKNERDDNNMFKVKRCKVCDLYHKLKKDDMENIDSKKVDTPNFSYRIRARIVHEEWDGLTKLNAEQTKPIDMIYCPLCGKKLWESSFASRNKNSSRPKG